MAERIEMITHLRNFADNAAQRGDDRAAGLLREAAQMLYDDGIATAKLAHRRTSDADRQERQRERRRKRESHVSNVTSRDKRDSLSFSPTPPFPNPEEEARDTAREREYAEGVESLLGVLHSRVGDELWPEVDAFVKRRDYLTWRAWIKEMLSVITGGHADVGDLAQVCRDEQALTRPIGSPKGLRTFVASAVQERLSPSVPGNRGAGHGARRGGVAQRTFDNGRRALEDM